MIPFFLSTNVGDTFAQSQNHDVKELREFVERKCRNCIKTVNQKIEFQLDLNTNSRSRNSGVMISYGQFLVPQMKF